VFIALLAALALGSYAATPEAAAIHAIYVDSSKPPVVQRTNVTGRYATVLLSGAMMEGSAVTAPILVEHFSFGWQALDVLNYRCRLKSHALGTRVDALLMRGMPRPQDQRVCGKSDGFQDAGPQVEVEAVRRLMRGALVPSVAVVGNWALGSWYGAGGGESLYQLRAGRWKFVGGGGGAMGVAEIRAYGVPKAAWCMLGIYDAKCP
jgi:hypothetical protein